MKKFFAVLCMAVCLSTGIIDVVNAQILLSDSLVVSKWVYDDGDNGLEQFELKVDGAGNSYVKYFDPGARYPWNGWHYWVTPMMNASYYGVNAGSPFSMDPDVGDNTVEIEFDVDSAGNRYYVINAQGYDSVIANGVVYPPGLWTVSYSPASTIRWTKSGIGIVRPDNKGNSFFIRNDSLFKLDTSGNTLFSVPVDTNTNILSPDQYGGVFLKNGVFIRHRNAAGGLSWSRQEVYAVADPRGNLYLQVHPDSAIKIDRFNNQLWKRKRSVVDHLFDYAGNSYTLGLTKYNAQGVPVWEYCHVGGIAFAFQIDANNRVHCLAAVGNGNANYYYSDYLTYVDGGSAYFIQVIGQGQSSFSINVMPNGDVFDYWSYSVPVCECKLTIIPFSTQCKNFNTGNVFSLWLCDSLGQNCMKISDIAAVQDTFFNQVGFPAARPGNMLKITSTNPPVTSALFEYPISAGSANQFYLQPSQTTPSCDSIQLSVSSVDCYGAYRSYLRRNGSIVDSLDNANTYSVKTSGDYSILMQTFGVDCPVETDTLSLVVSPAVTASVSYNSAATVCSGQTVSFVATTNAPNYRWERNGVHIIGADNTPVYSAVQSGFYRIYANNGLGCGKYAGAKKATIGITQASIVVNGSTSFCNGDSVSFNAVQQTGFTYQWRRNGVSIAGATNAIYYAKTSGTYRCLFTNTSGCTKLSNAYTVNVNCRSTELPAPSVLSVYPNPLQGEEFAVECDVPAEQGEAIVEVFNSLGQKLYSERVLFFEGILTHRVVFPEKPVPQICLVQVKMGDQIYSQKIMIK